MILFAVLENVTFDKHTREVDYSDGSITGKYQLFEFQHKYYK